jgi:hypothetical protein
VKNKSWSLFVAVFLAAPITALPLAAPARPESASKQRSEKAQEKLVKEVRRQLVMLPYYSVFDNLAYKVDGDKVTPFGQVTRPILKSDAEAAVATPLSHVTPFKPCLPSTSS